MIPTSPADAKKLTLPKIVTPEVEIFTKQEAAAILDSLADEPLQFQACIQLAILTGARLGELVAFNKADLLKFRNFGKKSLTELEELVRSKGLEFGMNVSKYKLDKE